MTEEEKLRRMEELWAKDAAKRFDDEFKKATEQRKKELLHLEESTLTIEKIHKAWALTNKLIESIEKRDEIIIKACTNHK